MATEPSEEPARSDALPRESPREASSSSSSAVQETLESWARPVFEAAADRTGSGSRRVVVVPDGASLYSLQRACVAPALDGRLLTARYVVPGPAGLGTMLAALVGDVERLTTRQGQLLGDLADQERGARWAALARRAATSPAWGDFVERLPQAVAAGRFEIDTLSYLADVIDNPDGAPSLLQEGEVLVLLLDTADGPVPDVTAVLDTLARSPVILAVTVADGLDLDPLTELIGPVTRLPRYSGDAPPGESRLTYDDSALSADQPTDQDTLGMTGLALTTAKLLMHKGTGPMCVGIEAPWGKGKSSFLRLVRSQAARQTAENPAQFDLLPVDFNAWVYSNAEQAWAGLAAEVITAAERSLSRRDRVRVQWSYAWRNRRALVLGALVSVVLALSLSALVAGLNDWNFATTTQTNPLALTLGTYSPTLVAVLVLVAAAYRLAQPVSERVHEYLARPDHSARRGYQNDVVDDLRFTLGWLRRIRPRTRVVVMVDDLDRCAEDKVVEILQAINVVLAQSAVYTLLAIDGDMVRRAVFRHYRDSDEDKLPVAYQLHEESFAHEYLEKIVQFSIRLPPTSTATRSAYVRSLFTLPTPVEPATRTVAGPRPGGKLVRGLEIDLSQVAQISGTTTDLPLADTPAESDAMATYQVLLDDNPRGIKRAVNVHRFVKIALYRSENPPSPEVQRRLVLWVVLCLTDPVSVAALLRRTDLENSPDDLLELLRANPPEKGRVAAWMDVVLAEHDELPLADLPLLVDAANLIQLVGAPGRDTPTSGVSPERPPWSGRTARVWSSERGR